MMTDEDSRTDNDARAQRILDAASRLIIHYGYDKTTVSDVAREAGVSKGAIYLHWDSKEALFEALLERDIQRYSGDWLAAFEADESIWNFVDMMKMSLLVMQDYPFITALMRRDERVLGSYLRRDSRLVRQKGMANADLFARMQQVGATRDDIPPRIIAHLTTVIELGILSASEYLPEEEIPPYAEVVDGLAKLLDRGLAPVGQGNPQAARALIIQMTEALRAQLRAGERKR